MEKSPLRTWFLPQKMSNKLKCVHQPSISTYSKRLGIKRLFCKRKLSAQIVIWFYASGEVSSTLRKLTANGSSKDRLKLWSSSRNLTSHSWVSFINNQLFNTPPFSSDIRINNNPALRRAQMAKFNLPRHIKNRTNQHNISYALDLTGDDDRVEGFHFIYKEFPKSRANAMLKTKNHACCALCININGNNTLTEEDIEEIQSSPPLLRPSFFGFSRQ